MQTTIPRPTHISTVYGRMQRSTMLRQVVFMVATVP